MAEVIYECMFILDSNRFARDSGAVTGRLEKLITDRGGEVLVSRMWNEQKLAYPIQGQRKGTYWLMYFRIEGTALKGFDRDCQINEDVLRQLVIKPHPKVATLLVDHALGQRSEEPEAEEAPAEEAPAETAEAN